MTPRLDDKVALVAGGARGAGRGIAVELGAALLPVLAVRDGVGIARRISVPRHLVWL
jgi:NAD(P)-dependent dehydrogenase (short-subunit alcohol dehydrogenase family)